MDSHRWHRRLGAFLAVLLVTLLAISIPSVSTHVQQKPLRMQLRWLPQAQFAGFYVAKDHEFFRREGLSVTLEQGGPSVNGLQRLRDGEVDVTIAWTSDALDMRREAADLVNVAQLLQRPGTMLVCSAASGVSKAGDLKGKRVGTWFLADEFDVGYWLQRYGLGLDSVQLIEQKPAARDLLDGEVDCATAMSYNEFQTILQEGALQSDLFTVRFARENTGFLEDGLYVRATDLQDPAKRDRLTRFLKGLAAVCHRRAVFHSLFCGFTFWTCFFCAQAAVIVHVAPLRCESQCIA